MDFKKGQNLCIVEHGGVDYISFNDLSSPLKNRNGKLLDGALVYLLVADDELSVPVDRDTWCEDQSALRGFSISGARPKNIRKRK